MQFGDFFCDFFFFLFLGTFCSVFIATVLHKSTILLARNFFIWSSHLNKWVALVLHIALGSFLLFPFLLDHWFLKNGSATLNVFKHFNVAWCVCVFFSLGTQFSCFGDGCSGVYAVCKHHIWEHAYVNSVTENVT